MSPSAPYIGATDDARGPQIRTSLVVAVCPVLVEREREIGFLGRVAEAVASGPSQLVVLTGEAGAGKSRLAHELVAGLPDGWKVVQLVVESGAPTAAENHRGRDRPKPADPTTAIVASITTDPLAGHASGPTVVVIEDAERLDPAGVAALGSATEALERDHTLLLAQFRLGVHPPGSEPAGALADLLRRPFAHEVSLGPISAGGLRAMAEAMGRRLDEDEAMVLHARTAGNAFFSEEVLLAEDRSVPWTITDAVMRRITVLPASARAAVDLLAVAVDGVPRATLDELVDDATGVPALFDAGMARMTDTGEVSLRHALVGEVVAARLSGQDRRHLNHVLAVGLEPAGVPAERLARHWRDAGDRARAARHAAIAADRAAAGGAHRTATTLYRLALADPSDDPMLHAEVLERAAAAAGWAGLSQDAIAWATAADAAYREAGVPSRAVALWLNPGLNVVPKPPLDAHLLPDDDIERVLEDARVAAHERRYEDSATLARRAAQVASDGRDGGNWTVRASRRLIGAGYLAEGEEQLRRVRVMATAAGDRALLANALGQLSITAMLRSDLDECLAFQRQALATARNGNETSVWTHEWGMAMVRAYRGDLDEAMAAIETLRGLGSPLVTEFSQLPACVVDLERGDLETAAKRLDRMSAVAVLRVDEFTAGVLLVRARWSLESGDPTAALAALDEADAAAAELIETSLIDRLVCQARAAAALDDDEVIDRASGRLVQQVELGVGPGADAAVTWIDGFIAGRAGQHHAAVDQLAAAASAWEQLGRCTFAADACVDSASIAAAGGDHESFGRAVAWAEELARPRGLIRVLRQLDALVAASGGSSQTPAPDPSPLDGLTPREREIAELVAVGKTNREIGELLFISEHTVRNQLVRVFDKLGISRRTELARLVD